MNYICCGNWYFLKFWERPLVWSLDLSLFLCFWFFFFFGKAWRQRIKKIGFAGWLTILLLFYLKMASLQHGMKFAFFLFLNIVISRWESQNHRMVEVGRDLWKSSGPNTPAQSGPPRAGCPRLCPDSSAFLWNWNSFWIESIECVLCLFRKVCCW